jgi:hypothetical protein
MIKKMYVVTGITDQDWQEIFSCLRFASMFSDKCLKNNDLRILKNIQVRDLDQDKDIKIYIQKWLWKGD